MPSPDAAIHGVNRNAEKYQRILDAAVAVFAEKGFFISRISDIADRADVADGTVYLYFKSKEEILMTAINTAFDAFMSQARTELEKLPDPAERLRRLAFLHLDALGSNRNMAVVFPDGTAAEHPVSVRVLASAHGRIPAAGARGDHRGAGAAESFAVRCRTRLPPIVSLARSTRW